MVAAHACPNAGHVFGQRHLPSFPRRRESMDARRPRMPERRTRPRPAPPAVIPAKAGIHGCSSLTHARTPDTSSASATCRHSREGGNPWMFAAHACPNAGHVLGQRHLPSFPRRRESMDVRRPRMPERRTRPRPAPPAVIPAKAGIHGCSPVRSATAPDSPSAGVPALSLLRRSLASASTPPNGPSRAAVCAKAPRSPLSAPRSCRLTPSRARYGAARRCGRR